MWLWPIYSVSALTVVGFSKQDFSAIILILIALPAPLLLVAYWFAVWTQSPKCMYFDTQSPESICRFYNASVRSKALRLHWALGMALAASVSVALAIMLTALGMPRVPSNVTAIARLDAGKPEIEIAGHFAASTKVNISVKPTGGRPDETTKTTQLTDSSGVLRITMSASATTLSTYNVDADWLEAAVHRRAGITIPKAQ